MNITITVHHEKSTKNYEKYSSSKRLCSIYIPKEEFTNGGYPANTIPATLRVVVTNPAD